MVKDSAPKIHLRSLGLLSSKGLHYLCSVVIMKQREQANQSHGALGIRLMARRCFWPLRHLTGDEAIATM
jgi:hypothetical protein